MTVKKSLQENSIEKGIGNEPCLKNITVKLIKSKLGESCRAGDITIFFQGGFLLLV